MEAIIAIQSWWFIDISLAIRFSSADPGCPVDNWSPAALKLSPLSILQNPSSLLLLPLMLTAPLPPCVPQAYSSVVTSHSSICKVFWNPFAYLCAASLECVFSALPSWFFSLFALSLHKQTQDDLYNVHCPSYSMVLPMQMFTRVCGRKDQKGNGKQNYAERPTIFLLLWL